MKILVVDDKQSLSDLVAQFLGQTYQVTTVENGMQALASLQGGNVPDLIITDLEMPEMDGFELIKQVKAAGLFSDIPIIVLSCRDSSADRIKCLQLGADDYLVKPFNPEELLIVWISWLSDNKFRGNRTPFNFTLKTPPILMEVLTKQKTNLLYVGKNKDSFLTLSTESKG